MIKHLFVSSQPDDSDPTHVQGHHWNQDHEIDDPAAVIAALNLATVAVTGNASDLTGSFTNSNLAAMPAHTFKANNSGASATPSDITTAQAKALLAITTSDISGLSAVASSGSASDLTTGILPAGRFPALTGDVTSSSGSVATTIASHAVTNAKAAQMAGNTVKANLTGITADATDSTLSALATAMSAFFSFGSGEFGTGDDGSATMDGVATVPGYTLSGSTYIATRTANFVNLTVNSGITVDQRTWAGPNVRQTLTNNGHISWDGENASGQSGGTTGGGVGPLPVGTAGGSGGASNSGGSNPASANSLIRGFSNTLPVGGGGNGVNGGAGRGGSGGGSLASGGSGGSASVFSPAGNFDTHDKLVLTTGYMITVAATKLGAATGGGGGAGGGTSSVGGGGGAGGSWGVMRVFNFAGTGTYTSIGGNGGDGTSAVGVNQSGGGGGAGGGGGIIVIVTASQSPPISSATQATVCAGGLGGAGAPGNGPSGISGGNGGLGGAGLVFVFN